MDLLEKIIFGLIVIALPIAEVARFQFNDLAITLLDVGIALSVLFWIFLKRRIPSSHLNKPILLFAAILFVSLLVNTPHLNLNELFTSSLYLFRWTLYALTFFMILDLGSLRNKIEKVMIISGAFIVAAGFIQYFLYPDLRNLYYAGWDEHLYRMFTWTFFDPNFAGSFLVLYFLFLLRSLEFKNKKNILLPLLTLTAIILTFSRSAYIMLFVGVLIYSFFLKQKIIAVAFLLLILLSILGLSTISSRSEGTNLLRTASGEARLDSIQRALIIFKDHPIFGVGFNSFRYAQRDYGFLKEQKMIIHSGAGTDNSFLFVLATSGIVGFAAFIYLLFKMISVGNSLVVSSFLALVVNSLFINSFFYPPIMFWMWILIGIRLKNT